MKSKMIVGGRSSKQWAGAPIVKMRLQRRARDNKKALLSRNKVLK